MIFCLGLVAGVFVFSIHEHERTVETIDYYHGEKITVFAIIDDEPVFKNSQQQFTARTKQLDNQKSVVGKIRVTTDPFPVLAYGDWVKITCRLERPENKYFNYERYLARYDIYALCYRAQVAKIVSGKGNPLRNFLITLKNNSLDIIKRHINEPEASIIGPVLFGGGEDISEDLVADFRRTGLTHIMAVSGFNVGILAAGIGYLLFAIGLNRKWTFIITSVMTAAYVVMVGAPASAVRAGVMSILILLSLAVGRLATFINIVVITAAATLVINPRLLAADLGWQLSFAAVLGLIYIHPFFKKIFEKICNKKIKILSEGLAATLAAQISTTFISLYNFGQVSLIAPLSNMLVVWSIPFLTAASALALPIAALFPAAGDVVFLPSYFLMKYIIFVVSWLSKPQWAAISLDN